MKRVSLLSLMAAMLLSLSVVTGTAFACGVGEKVDGYENADVKHAYEHWLAGDKSPIPFIFIDVRTPEEYAGGHIRGAKLIPLQELEQRLAEVPKDRQVYLYCHSGRRSADASKILVKAGYTNIENVSGGITAWREAGYPTVK